MLATLEYHHAQNCMHVKSSKKMGLYLKIKVKNRNSLNFMVQSINMKISLLLFAHSDFALLTGIQLTLRTILHHCKNINDSTYDPTEKYIRLHIFIIVLTLLLWLIVQLWHIDFATILRYPQITSIYIILFKDYWFSSIWFHFKASQKMFHKLPTNDKKIYMYINFQRSIH